MTHFTPEPYTLAMFTIRQLSDLNGSDLGSEAIAALRAGFGVACRIAMTHGDKLPHLTVYQFLVQTE